MLPECMEFVIQRNCECRMMKGWMEMEWNGWGVMFSGEEYECRMMWEWGNQIGRGPGFRGYWVWKSDRSS
jgi:hypothetical protein